MMNFYRNEEPRYFALERVIFRCRTTCAASRPTMCSFDRADVLLELVLANGTVAVAGGDTATLRYLTFMHVCVCICITRDTDTLFFPLYMCMCAHVQARARR